jgi:hypothetical protein
MQEILRTYSDPNLRRVYSNMLTFDLMKGCTGNPDRYDYSKSCQMQLYDMFQNSNLLDKPEIIERFYVFTICNFRTNRLAESDIDIEGFKIPKGTDISFPIYSIHRDPKYWENPTKFDPDRYYIHFRGNYVRNQ